MTAEYKTKLWLAMQKFFPGAYMGKIFAPNMTPVDLYIEDIETVIWFDNYVDHKSIEQAARDIEETSKFVDAGFNVIRIRHPKLASLGVGYSIYMEDWGKVNSSDLVIKVILLLALYKKLPEDEVNRLISIIDKQIEPEDESIKLMEERLGSQWTWNQTNKKTTD